MIELYREPSPQLIRVPWQGIVLDRGVLKKAIKSSKGDFLFSEQGAGVQPLVIIGKLSELVDFFYMNQNVFISNEIRTLPDIYIGISKFIEKERYDGTYPVNIAINALTRSILDFIPGNSIIDVLSNTVTFRNILKDLINSNHGERQTDVLYLKISYLNDFQNNGKKIGSKKISFETIFRYLLGINETPV
ncbi:hypothetical protein SGQ83_21465 [Flavobacterium sp. Fl-318]|uniref:Uncharacterized protein n=1 Tax=Flavobacterium cupriresistens TaxID=2893885 RepID=A0ABU4RHA3_9FLAO|nr:MULTISPECIES: hypothetical protein [unclassified Flavobacterium]MDX6191933.1 hypothetical protein [Flavobacterium sp. Fl-318]UFH44572.1 hypothetical protein LNP23_10265 [Flavobacterium sp. F-323]